MSMKYNNIRVVSNTLNMQELVLINKGKNFGSVYKAVNM